jgi:uncharacterized protein YecT (DUF1311 family)
MRRTIVRAVIVTFGLLCAGVVGLMIFVGGHDRYQELDELSGHFESNPTPQHLRDLLNYPSDAASSHYKFALIGASVVKHPTVFQMVADDLHTDEERYCIQELASRGADVFEHHPGLKPNDFEKRFEEQNRLTRIRGKVRQGDIQEIELAGKTPEDFDWEAYFATTDNSTRSDYTLAYNAHKVLRTRIDELCAQYRELMISRNQTQALALFDEAQQHWEKFAASEIQFVGSAWDGGSGAKVAYARHRFKVYLTRAKELTSLKGSMHLNE